MKIKWARFLICFVGVGMIFVFSSEVQADSVRTIKTEGNIGFYGKYESDLEPQPKPPNGPESIPNESGQKPGGQFPQTGQFLTQNWFWLGISLILLALFGWKKKQNNSDGVNFYVH